jgi:hypothetical protein
MRLNYFFIFAIYCSFAGAQEQTGMAIDPSANNIAALFTMTNESGRIRNLELMESVFQDKSLGFKSERHHNVSSSFIYSKMKELAENLEPGATLLLYFNSHGGGSGDRFGMTAQGGNFKFSKALDSLKKSGKTIKRLIFLVDTCHAEGSIQDSLKQDGELLKNIQTAKPTNFLPELPDQYSRSQMPFISIFLNKNPIKTNQFEENIELNYGKDSGVYEEILIISSSSVEDLSIRGAFASRFAETFKKIKDDKSITVGQFLKKFAESHGRSGQQPHYKILPTKTMLGELLFGPWFIQTIPIIDYSKSGNSFDFNFIPMPSK